MPPKGFINLRTDENTERALARLAAYLNIDLGERGAKAEVVGFALKFSVVVLEALGNSQVAKRLIEAVNGVKGDQ
jgi:hypothetical protein